MKWVCAEIVDRDGKSSLLSLVKAFDSILEVYEGFCNLKQVNCLLILLFYYFLFSFILLSGRFLKCGSSLLLTNFSDVSFSKTVGGSKLLASRIYYSFIYDNYYDLPQE